jgi:signal transduction histidine kinase
MKTPLQVIVLDIDLLKERLEGRLDGTDLESLDSILSYIRQVDVMVKSVLDLSRLESGKLPLNRAEQDLGPLLKETVHFLGTVAAETTISVEMSDGVPPVDGDAEVIKRIMLNLLFNAVKYSPTNGRIRVGASVEGGLVRVSVTDQGPGIPEECREKIFEKFGQVRSKRHQRRDSSGLGLTFCKLAVEAHGGRIGVDSNEGCGSTFWFTIPAAVTTGLHPVLDAVSDLRVRPEVGARAAGV